MFHTAFIICRKNALAYLKNIRSILKHLDSSSFISQRNPTTYDRPPLPCTYPFARNWAWRKCWRVRDIPCTIKAPWLLSSKQLTLSQSPYFLPFFFFYQRKYLLLLSYFPPLYWNSWVHQHSLSKLFPEKKRNLFVFSCMSHQWQVHVCTDCNLKSSLDGRIRGPNCKFKSWREIAFNLSALL